MQLIEFQLLLLIIAANGAPILGTALLGTHGAWPIDGGLKLRNGYPLLGESKTWRGVMLALIATCSMACLLDISIHIGLIIGCFAMLGDILSSFIKRRLGMAPSSMALGLDQIPESLLPLLAVKNIFNLKWWTILEMMIAFLALVLMLSWILYQLRIRKQPY